MPKFIPVATISGIPENQSKVVEVDGKLIALFNVKGTIYAVSHVCAHEGGPLGEGYLSEYLVTCPFHAWQYDVRDGKCVTVDGAKIASYPVKVEKETVLVGV